MKALGSVCFALTQGLLFMAWLSERIAVALLALRVPGDRMLLPVAENFIRLSLACSRASSRVAIRGLRFRLSARSVRRLDPQGGTP